MDTVVFVHLFAVALWLGCVFAETIMELVGRASEEAGRTVSKMHFYIDIFVEAPLLIVMLASGFMLLDVDRLSGLYLVKVVCGFVAIAGNFYCIFYVIKRKRRMDIDSVTQGHETDKIFLTVIAYPFAAIALVLGIYLLGLS